MLSRAALPWKDPACSLGVLLDLVLLLDTQVVPGARSACFYQP